MADEDQNFTVEDTDVTSIYEGGALTEIKVTDLLDNEVAIRQLINENNRNEHQLRNKETEIENYKSQAEYLKTSPFVAIIAAIINIAGAILLGAAVNFMTDKAEGPIPIIMLILSAILLLTGSLGTILYPYARKWFN